MPRAIRSAFEFEAESELESRRFRSGARPRLPHAAESIPVPERLARYEIEAELGRGGVGVVYRAKDPDIGRTVALKVLRPSLLSGDEPVRRFRDEARTCSSLEHPGIVPVHEVGMLDDGRPYYSMRLVSGRTLTHAIRDGSRPWLLARFVEICEVLAYAHARGVVHGDVKPANVLIGEFGEVQVVDWGFTRTLDAASEDDAPRRVFGTPGYMAPEQLGDRAVPADTPADVFALGAMLFEFLAKVPVASATTEHFARGGDRDATERIRRRLGDCGADPALVDLSMACLDPDPRRRPSAAEVARCVSDCLERLEERARELDVASALARSRAQAAVRARSLTIALAVCVVIVVSLAAWFEISRRERIGVAADSVRRAMNRATRQLERVGEAPLEEAARWDEALQLASTAVELAQDRLVDPDLRTEAAAFEASVAAGRRVAREDREMLARLDQLRDHHAEDTCGEDLCDGYRGAFVAFGLGLTPTSRAEDLARLRSSSIVDRLVAALDRWMFVAQRCGDHGPALARDLGDLASEVDTDSTRAAVRLGFLSGDADAILSSLAEQTSGDVTLASLGIAAKFLARFGRTTDAIRLYRRAHRLDPSDFDTTHDLAIALLSRPDYDRAEVHTLMAQTVAIHPQRAHTWTDLAVAAFGVDRIREGDDALDRALEVDPRYARAIAWRGQRAIARGDRLEGARLLAEALQLDPAYYPAWNALGSLFSRQGLVFDAERCLRRAAELAPHDPVIQYYLGLTRLQLREPEGALEFFEESAKLREPEAELLCATGFALLLSGRFDQAREKVSEGLASAPAEPSWEYVRESFGPRIEAISRLAQAHPTIDPGATRPGDVLDLALVATLRDDHAVAVELYRMGFGEDPDARFVESLVGTGHPWCEPHLGWAAAAALRLGYPRLDEPTPQTPAVEGWRIQGRRWLEALVDRIEARWRADDQVALLRGRLCRLESLLDGRVRDRELDAIGMRIRDLRHRMSAEFVVPYPR